MEKEKLQVLMDDIRGWASVQFPEQTAVGKLKHLEKEVVELIEALNKEWAAGSDNSVGVGEYGRAITHANEEFADCFMLLVDVASIEGLNAKNLLVEVAYTYGRNDTSLSIIETFFKAEVALLRLLSSKKDMDASLQFALCFKILNDAAFIFGLYDERFEEEVRNKLEINKKRKWPGLNKEGFSEHIKD